MTKRRGRNVELSNALGGLVERLDRKAGGAGTQAKLVRLWEDTAGPIVTAHTTGVHLRDGVLVVYVDSNARANDMSALSEIYRTTLNSGLGKEVISKVTFTVSRKVMDEMRLSAQEADLEEFYREDDVEPVALTENELAQIRASVASIPDETLKQAVLSATVKDLEWKKGIAARNSREAAREDS
jgi:hypothetical protein